MTNHDRFASVFKNRIGRTFSTAEIVKIMLAESGIERGSILPNDHGEGNLGQCVCVGTDRQIFDRVGRGIYRVRQFRNGVATVSSTTHGQRGGSTAKPAAYGERSESAARQLWNSTDSKEWERALDRYWDFVKPPNLALEREMDRLDAEIVRAMNPEQWYEFLLEKYFRWKYTAPNRYGSTTKMLRSYKDNDQLLSLYDIKERLFAFDRRNVQQGLALASRIRGLGTAGASGLLAVLFSTYFGTVDQFAVKALAGIPELPERDRIAEMKPESLTLSDGTILITVMRRKADELNRLFSTTKWTPRQVDMVLWTCAR